MAVDPSAYDLVVLDLMLPESQGLDVLKRFREQADVPVLVLSARNETSTKVRALELGGENYLYDSMYVRWRVRQGAPLRIVGEPLNRLGYHAGVLRSRGDLLARANAAIKELLASGEIARIRLRWEGVAPARP